MGSGAFERASLELVTLVVDDYDDAIAFFVDVLAGRPSFWPGRTARSKPLPWATKPPAE